MSILFAELETILKSISIRNVPDDVYIVLQAMAKVNRRSLQEQVKILLEQEIRLQKGSSVTKSSEWRDRLKSRKMSNIVQSIRKDRER